MTQHGSSLPDPDDLEIVEAFARVVAVDRGRVLLEPEESKACGGCHSAGLCGLGSRNAGKLAARRFTLHGDFGLRVGERVVVGIPEGSLSKGAMVAFGVPLLGLIGGGIAGQESLGTDQAAFFGAMAGAAVGFLVSRVLAGVMARRGQLTPRFLRRAYGAEQGGGCPTDLG